MNVIVHNEALSNDNVLDIFAQYDLIVDGTDNFATRYMVNDAAVFLKKPYVWGSIYRFDGQASVFWAEHGPCYRCLYPEPPPPGMVPCCAEGGVLGVLCASIGSIQVTEAIKLLTGIGDPLLGRLMVYDALEMTYRKITHPQGSQLRGLRREPDRHRTDRLRRLLRCACPTRRSRAATGSTITARGAEGVAGRGQVDPPGRRARAGRVGDRADPRRGARAEGRDPVNGAALADLPQDKQIVLYCKSGVRSAEALAAVKAAGFKDAVHVQGGVSSWVKTVDPSLPVY